MRSISCRVAAAIAATAALSFVVNDRLQRAGQKPAPAPASPVAATSEIAPADSLPNHRTTTPAPPPGRSSVVVTPLSQPSKEDWLQASKRSAAFDNFAQWTERWAARTAATAGALEEEGAQVATQRREELATLIKADPETALQIAVPAEVRAALPAPVHSLLETPVSARGDLAVVGVLAEPGYENTVRPLFHVARFNGQEYDAYVYGRRSGEPTRFNVPLHGIALDGTMAVHESPVRVLSAFEAKLVAGSTAGAATPNSPARGLKGQRTRDPVCAVSGEPSAVNDSETLADVGGEVFHLCGVGHADELNSRFVAAEGVPGLADSNTSGDPAESAYTEGHKRIIFIRVDFPNLQGAPFSDLAGLQLITNVNNYFTEASYGRMTVALPGNGSHLTPTFRMTNNAAYYGTNNYYDRLRAEARAAADAAGYNRTNYEFHVICMGPVPGFTWGGLGYVGGTGAWIRNTSSTGTTVHELGHNLGLNHANYWDTAGQSTIGAGTSVEYGDSFDTMGGGGSSRHFQARYRAHLNWLTTSEFVTFSTNGVYRIMAYDVTNSSGVRALRIARNSGNSQTNNYWLEFRQRSSATRWETNGIGLRWAGNGNQSSLLLDTTPGSPDNKNDSALQIGRTFSDRVFGIHITPLRRVNTVPASMDIVVNRGNFPTNEPPVVAITASTTNPAVNVAVTLTAAASDPNGDALSYFWEFGDGTFGTNGATATKSFNSSGEYVVRCTASDMRGGVASDSVLVRVGNPTTYRIAGRVLLDDEGLQGVRVTAGATRIAYTDSDGSYTLVGLPAGSYTVDAVLEGYSFTHPAFANPVGVGPLSAANVDFIATSGNNRLLIPILALGSQWKYLDDGSDQGTNWIGPSFNDATWDSGPAQLGYGDGDEQTVVSYGASSSQKHITTYFRHAFLVDDPEAFATLTLGLIRDDGAVVYLNGREIFRSNMPGGPIGYRTVASSAVDGNNESAIFETDVSPSLLVEGTNLVAVEIHQSSSTSSDISFDLFLNALSVTNLPRGVFITAPSPGASLGVGSDIVLAANASAGPGNSITNVEFFIDGSRIGSMTARPYTLTWPNAPIGIHTLTAEATDTSGTILTSAPVVVNVDVLLARGSTWKYFDKGSSPGTLWGVPAFNDAGWSNGLARLGYGGDGEVTTVNFGPSSGSKYVTTYFRRAFVVPPGVTLTNATCRFTRDDGIVAYLNGTEILRDNMPSGGISYGTFAVTSAGGADETTFFEVSVPAALFVEGTNVIAAEVHQSSANSSDLGFDLEFAGLGYMVEPHPPSLGIERDGSGLVLSWPVEAAGFELYSSDSIGAATWAPVNAPITVTNGRKSILDIPNGTTTRFYRLHRNP